MSFIKHFIILVFVQLLERVYSGSSLPTVAMTDLSYFASRKFIVNYSDHMSFISSVELGAGLSYMSNTNYTLNRNLPHSYYSVKLVRASMGTFTTSVAYFGFTATAYYTTDPVTSIKINLTTLNTTYSQIGLNVILICGDFSSVVTLVPFTLTSH